MGHTASVSSLMEQFSKLPLDDRSFAIDLMQRQMVDARRMELGRRAAQAFRNYKQGKVKKGSIADLKRTLEND